MNNELNHYGVNGMKWGKRKASGGKTSSNKSKKKLKLNVKKKFDGRDLADDILLSVGGVVLSNLVGNHLILKGHETAGGFIKNYGTISSVGHALGKTISRVE